jgi:hypothetical protein
MQLATVEVSSPGPLQSISSVAMLEPSTQRLPRTRRSGRTHSTILPAVNTCNRKRCSTAKRRHSGRVGGAKRPSGRNKDLHAAL